MSQSRRKTPIFGLTGAKSERRAKVRSVLTAMPLMQLDGYVAPIENEVGSVWEMAKDGKHYFGSDRQDAVATRFVAAERKLTVKIQSVPIPLGFQLLGRGTTYC